MNLNSTRTRLLATSMITTVAMAATAGGAFAQAAPAAAADQSTSVQELVVTGSRIPTPNLTSVSPISSVSQNDLKQSGTNDLVDALDNLPQVNGGLNNTPNPLSGSAGFTTVDLRNLGAVRTLVLEDGKRLMPGDPTLGGEAADIDTVPAILIDRVEVVTGGASAVYGSDAIAGVVNFIMKHNFQGVRLDVNYSGNWHENGNTQMQGLEKAFGGTPPSGNTWDGGTWDASIAVGANTPDDKGNVTAYLSYRHQDPVTQGMRDYSYCQLSQNGHPPSCTGSSNSNLFYDDAGIHYSVTGVAPDNIFTTDRGQFTTPPSHFNASPYEYLSRGDERYQGGFFAHYQAAPWADVYSDFSFMDDRTVIHAAPSALFQQPFLVNCTNPFLSAQQVNTICTNDGGTLVGDDQANAANDGCPVIPGVNGDCMFIGRRDVEGGPRIYSFDHISYKADIGVKGDLGDAWHYDVYGQFGRTQFFTSVQNDISLSKAQNALLVGGTAANPVCLGGQSGCIPYDIFQDGGVTPGSLGYILTSGTSSGDTQEQIVSGNITGELGKYGIKSPWAHDGFAVNIGAEYRREQLDLTPDAASLSGDLSGAGGATPPVHGAFDVKEVFGELRAPLIQDMPFVKDLTFDGGYRFSSYSGAGDTSTYKLALSWSPTSDIRFRGSYQRAVRAPNTNELFAPPYITNTSVVSVDPCAPEGDGNVGTPASASLAACENTGVKASQYGNGGDPATGGTDTIPQCPAGQCAVVSGGYTKLTPEVARTYSVGVVITPTQFVRHLQLTVDYYNINLNNAISVFPINLILSDCLTSDTQCDSIHRTANGALFSSNMANGGYIDGQNRNIGHIATSGIDVTAAYRLDLDSVGLSNMGSLALTFNGSWTNHLTFEPVPGLGTYDCAGLYGNTCGGPTPHWRHVARVTYTSPWQWDFSLQWRYIGPGNLDNNQANPLLNAGSFDANDAHIGAFNYLDLYASYKVRPGITLRVGINNVFDKDPPILDQNVTGSGSPNSYPIYDLLGRHVFMGLTADF